MVIGLFRRPWVTGYSGASYGALFRMLGWNSTVSLDPPIHRSNVPTLPPRIDFYEATDGRRLAVRVWDPSSSPRGRVVFVHGITSHGGWYSHSCEYLAKSGFEAHFLDRRGSGLNCDAAGDVDRWTTWIDDVVRYLERLPQPRHVALCGISWGGKLATAVARRHPGLVQSLGLICPGFFSPHEPGVLKRLILVAGRPVRLQKRRVKIPLDRPALFTDTPKRRDFIARDPLALHRITWRFAREDRRLTSYARQAGPFLHLPALLMLAGRDRIVDNRRTRAFFTQIRSRCRMLIEYPNAAHTLEFEPDPAPYLADLTRWVAATADP